MKTLSECLDNDVGGLAMQSKVLSDRFWSSGRNKSLLALVAVAIGIGLAGCEKPAQAPAASAPAVTVANPTKRTVTDWDEFTGRFDAIEQVQVRARVTGFVMSVDFKDGAIV
ncbi:MAG: multidrug efflux pump subunit AcrA (membrane-fusion protein), partial [Afipia broomeae]